jgi:hypothetical protein
MLDLLQTPGIWNRTNARRQSANTITKHTQQKWYPRTAEMNLEFVWPSRYV